MFSSSSANDVLQNLRSLIDDSIVCAFEYSRNDVKTSFIAKCFENEQHMAHVNGGNAKGPKTRTKRNTSHELTSLHWNEAWVITSHRHWRIYTQDTTAADKFHVAGYINLVSIKR